MKKPKINKAALTEYAGMILGGIAASKVANIKLPVALPGPVQALLPAVLGVFLAGQKGFIGNVGKGLVVVGGIKALGTLAPQLGISQGLIDSDGYIAPVGAYQIEGADYALAGKDMSLAGGKSSFALAGIDQDDNAAFG